MARDVAAGHRDIAARARDEAATLRDQAADLASVEDAALDRSRAAMRERYLL